MTREEAKTLSPVRNTWIEGKVVQYRFTDIATACWCDYTDNYEPIWGGTHGPLEWRVKPEPKEVWVRDGGILAYSSKEKVASVLECTHTFAGTFRLYREVEGVKL